MNVKGRIKNKVESYEAAKIIKDLEEVMSSKIHLNQVDEAKRIISRAKESNPFVSRL